jgi:hypothetical protein
MGAMKLIHRGAQSALHLLPTEERKLAFAGLVDDFLRHRGLSGNRKQWHPRVLPTTQESHIDHDFD